MEQLIYSGRSDYLKKSSQEVLSTIQYTVVERFIENFEQQKKEFHYTLSLTRTAVYSNSHHFLLETLFDVSFKPLSNGQSFLYLHTNQGLFSFIISSNPEKFIQTFKSISK